MTFLSKIGEFCIALFDLIGGFVIRLTKLPQDIKNMDLNSQAEKLAIKETISKNIDTSKDILKTEDISTANALKKYFEYSSKEKENIVLKLQLTAGMFLIVSILHTFNYIPLYLFGILGLILAVYLIYTLFTQVKMVYPNDFNAYRDFFLMYVAIGIIIVLISYNPVLMSIISFTFLPTLSILIYTVILVVAIFVIFRLMHSRNFTYGLVLDSGTNTANVRIDYDICSNVKPDIYIVENHMDAQEGDLVKVSVEGKLLSSGGNRPRAITEII